MFKKNLRFYSTFWRRRWSILHCGSFCGFLTAPSLLFFTDLDHSKGARSESRHFLLAWVLESFSIVCDTERLTALVTYSSHVHGFNQQTSAGLWTVKQGYIENSFRSTTDTYGCSSLTENGLILIDQACIRCSECVSHSVLTLVCVWPSIIMVCLQGDSPGAEDSDCPAVVASSCWRKVSLSTCQTALRN